MVLGPLELTLAKNTFDADLIWMFLPEEKTVAVVPEGNIELLGQYLAEEYIASYKESDPVTRVAYQASVEAVRDRLDLKGFTLEVAGRIFQSGLDSKLASIDSHSSYDGEDRHVLQSLSIESWLDAFIDIHQGTDDQWESDQSYLKRHMFTTGYYGFPSFDVRHLLRILLDRFHDHEKVIYDITDLVAGGWIEQDDELDLRARQLADLAAVVSKRTIVLTEGKTDREFLERSLGLLLPHLSPYFHFFDFVGGNQQGGAGTLANLVRAFAAADVEHRILALFDNDTAARSAASTLSPATLPRNIVVRHYPNLDIACKYPTKGPSGFTTQNVNGLAASLELYLGEDVLKDENGELRPVEWRGPDAKLNAYQGEVFGKRAIQEGFRRKLSDCEGDSSKIGAYDWVGITRIHEVMRTAFQEVNAEAILQSADHE